MLRHHCMEDLENRCFGPSLHRFEGYSLVEHHDLCCYSAWMLVEARIRAETLVPDPLHIATCFLHCKVGFVAITMAAICSSKMPVWRCLRRCAIELQSPCCTLTTVEARKLEHDRPQTQNQRKKESQHKSSYVHVPTFWSLL